MSWKRMAEAVFLGTSLCGGVLARSTSGSVVGISTDPSGAAAPGVVVEWTRPSTGFARTTTTGIKGTFRFNSLDPATYVHQHKRVRIDSRRSRERDQLPGGWHYEPGRWCRLQQHLRAEPGYGDTGAEIRVPATNDQTEYGRGSGGQISVVTKAGRFRLSWIWKNVKLS
jgi:hypothetical protein